MLQRSWQSRPRLLSCRSKACPMKMCLKWLIIKASCGLKISPPLLPSWEPKLGQGPQGLALLQEWLSCPCDEGCKALPMVRQNLSSQLLRGWP